MRKWKCKKSEIIFKNKYFRIRKDLVELPDKKKRSWTYWDSRDSTMVLGLTKDKKLVMVRQYRYLVDDEVIEFPSGGLERNESIREGAKREFEEETGFKCGRLIKLGSFYETYGQLNRQIHIFFAKDVTRSKQRLDEGRKGFEDIKVELIALKKVIKLALENKIVCMGSTMAVLLLKEKIDRGEIKI